MFTRTAFHVPPDVTRLESVGEVAVRGSGESWEVIETNPDGLGASYFGAVAGRGDDESDAKAVLDIRVECEQVFVLR